MKRLVGLGLFILVLTLSMAFACAEEGQPTPPISFATGIDSYSDFFFAHFEESQCNVALADLTGDGVEEMIVVDMSKFYAGRPLITEESGYQYRDDPYYISEAEHVAPSDEIKTYVFTGGPAGITLLHYMENAATGNNSHSVRLYTEQGDAALILYTYYAHTGTAYTRTSALRFPDGQLRQVDQTIETYFDYTSIDDFWADHPRRTDLADLPYDIDKDGISFIHNPDAPKGYSSLERLMTDRPLAEQDTLLASDALRDAPQLDPQPATADMASPSAQAEGTVTPFPTDDFLLTLQSDDPNAANETIRISWTPYTGDLRDRMTGYRVEVSEHFVTEDAIPSKEAKKLTSGTDALVAELFLHQAYAASRGLDDRTASLALPRGIYDVVVYPVDAEGQLLPKADRSQKGRERPVCSNVLTLYVNDEGWLWPLPGYREIVSGYTRDSRVLKDTRGNVGNYPFIHYAIDIPTGGTFKDTVGEPVKVVASRSGTVEIPRTPGNCVRLRHSLPNGQTVYTFYQHVDPTVANGAEVSQGDTIATIQDMSGPHLHFAMSYRQNTYEVSPAKINVMPLNAEIRTTGDSDWRDNGSQDSWKIHWSNISMTDGVRDAGILYRMDAYTPDAPASPTALPTGIASVTPENGARGVGFYHGTPLALTITFDKPVKTLDFTRAAFTIRDYYTDEILFTASENSAEPGTSFDIQQVYGMDNKMLRVAPWESASTFVSGGTYYVTFEDGFVVFEDGSSVGIDSKDVWRFTCGFGHEGTYVTLPGQDGAPNRTFDYWYNDSFFEESGYQYRHDLARMSLNLAMAAFNDSNARQSGYKSEVAGKNIQKLLLALGFDTVNIDLYDGAPQIYSVGAAFGKKTIEQDGEPCTLIAVAVRGSGYEWEWAGNFVIDSAEEVHGGFGMARDTVSRELIKYILENQITGRIKLWIAGYSRAAATANLVAARLDDGYINRGDTFRLAPEDIYAYTFETPRNTRAADVGDALYGNIFNIINPVDPVPKVALESWGFKRYGTDLYVPSVGSGSDLVKRAAAAYKQYTGVAVNIPWDQGIGLDEIMNELDSLSVIADADFMAVLTSLMQEVMYKKHGEDEKSTWWDITKMGLATFRYLTEENIKGIGRSVVHFFKGEYKAGGEDLTHVTNAVTRILEEIVRLDGAAVKQAHHPELCRAWMYTITGIEDYTDGQ